MSPMARSFWAENRQVASRKTQAALGIAWRYPSYREGLRAILAEERRRASAVAAPDPAAATAGGRRPSPGDLHILAVDLLGDAQRDLPGHVRVALAVQQPHRAVERDAARQQQMRRGRPRSARG